jgi:ribose-phosphate pyrophosphokinase
VSAIASEADAPYTVLRKTRRGDRDVHLSLLEIDAWRDHTAVIVDDIVSSAGTMIETVKQVSGLGLKPAICVGVHGVFADGAYEALRAAGAARIVTTNTIAHETNAIDVTPLLASAALELLNAAGPG